MRVVFEFSGTSSLVIKALSDEFSRLGIEMEVKYTNKTNSGTVSIVSGNQAMLDDIVYFMQNDSLYKIHFKQIGASREEK